MSTTISDKNEALNCRETPSDTNLLDEIEIGSHKKLNARFKNVIKIKILKSEHVPFTIPELKIKFPKTKIKFIERPKIIKGIPEIAKLIPDFV